MEFSVFNTLGIVFSILGKYWWVYLPVLLFFGTLELYQNYTRTKFLLAMNWVLLEIKPPPDVRRSPKIAENFFAGLHGTYMGGTKMKDQFFQGKVPEWFSLEIVSNGGDMKFYIRALADSRNLIESAVFAQYPDAEIKQVDDYLDQFPQRMPNQEYDLFGSELIATRESAYPIKTWPEFEEEGGKDEFVRSDPLAPLAEVMTSLGPGEHLWLQYLVRPTGGDWVEDAQKIIDEIVGKKPKKESDALSKLVDSIDLALGGAPAEKKDEKEFTVQRLTPGQKFVLEQIENKVSKHGFKVGIRFMYLARTESFQKSRTPTVIGMFKQLYSNSLNTFKPDPMTMTKDRGLFNWIFPMDKGPLAEQRAFKKKVKMYRRYRLRGFPKKVVILNTEEMATLWHLPGLAIRAPAFPRVEAKKGTPPPGLPTR